MRNLPDSSCWMVQGPVEVNHSPILGGRLESEVRAGARGLEVLTSDEEALAQEQCECAGHGVYTTAENRQVPANRYCSPLLACLLRDLAHNESNKHLGRSAQSQASHG